MAKALEGILDVIEAIGHIANKLDDQKSKNDGVEILTAEKLRELKHMNSWKLDSIYHSGKRKVKVDDDPAAYRELRQMNCWQLESIFGDSKDW